MRENQAQIIINNTNYQHAKVNYDAVTRLMDLISDEELEDLIDENPEEFIPFFNRTKEDILEDPEGLKEFGNFLFSYLKIADELKEANELLRHLQEQVIYIYNTKG